MIYSQSNCIREKQNSNKIILQFTQKIRNKFLTNKCLYNLFYVTFILRLKKNLHSDTLFLFVVKIILIKIIKIYYLLCMYLTHGITHKFIFLER